MSVELTDQERADLWHAYERWEEGDDFGQHMGRAVERILAARTEQARPWDDCTGASDCPESWHEHGCYADDGQCSDPRDHHDTERARPEHVVKAEALREAADDLMGKSVRYGGSLEAVHALRDRADALEVQP